MVMRERRTMAQEFTVAQEIATFLASSGLLPKAWKKLLRACENIPQSFTLTEDEDVVYVAFPSFHGLEDFIVEEGKYGEGNLPTGNKIFSGCLKGNDDQPARVHQGALKLFLRIMENTRLEEKLQICMELKPVIFIGHFLGGSVATLATLWALGKRLKQSSLFCVTFGCPLVGDVRLVEAVDRQNWAGNFCHVVSQQDIVPRILIAPFESITEPLSTLLPYWGGIMTNVTKYASDYVIRDAYTALLHSISGLDGVISGSPYRPFGVYMFCSNYGAACIINSETVLKMLHLTLQGQEKSSDKSVREHINYSTALENVIRNSGRISSSNTESSYEMGISLQLKAIGMEAQNDSARTALLRVREIDNKHNTNASLLSSKLSRAQSRMAELEWYKDLCGKEDIHDSFNKKLGYYDSFRQLNEKRDINANLRREKLAVFWDEIVNMWQNHQLPSESQFPSRWTYAGNTYSRLVEPLDIAHYYRTSKGKGSYLSDGRPARHKIIQKWSEDIVHVRNSNGQKVRTKLASLNEDSCFWAHVEEALKDIKQGLHQKKERLETFEKYVTKMINDCTISSDVFLEGTSFIRWWQEYKRIQSAEWKSSSPLYKIMETASWKR
eukprot:PITA_00837